MQTIAASIAEIDVLSAFAERAQTLNYTAPLLSHENIIEIESGRHPVVERQVENYVPNDIQLGQQHYTQCQMLMITGPTNGKPRIYYDYDFTNCVDPDGDNMTYRVEWGDGDVDEGFIESGGNFSLSHSWSEKGDYTIKAQLIDIYGAESNWSTLEVTMPKNKALDINFYLLGWLLERFPKPYPLLRYLLKL